MKKLKGSVEELLSTGLCTLALTTVLFFFMQCVELLHQKEEIGQVARQAILCMETVGYLRESEKVQLDLELQQIGVTDLDWSGTTVQPVHYGDWITFQIRGKLKGDYEFEEKRVSTAKN